MRKYLDVFSTRRLVVFWAFRVIVRFTELSPPVGVIETT